MKEPEHPVRPAFDHARRGGEQWREREISALSREQAREYERRVQDEQKKLEAEKQRIDEGKAKKIEIEKQNLLSGQPVPVLRMAMTQIQRLKKAEELAKANIEERVRKEVEKAARDSRERLDNYLRQAERERTGQKKEEQDIRKEFNEKAQVRTPDCGDEALARAFEKASRRQEQQREQERKQSPQRDQDHGRDRGRN